MCVESISKILLIVMNIILFIGGGVIMIVGIIAYVDENLLFKLTSLLTEKLGDVFSDLEVLTQLDMFGLIKNNAIILIAVGGFLFLLGFLGCCGAMRKSSCMLNLYAILILVILAMEVGLGVYAYMASDKLEAQIQDGLKVALHKSYKSGARFDDTDKVVISTSAVEIAWDAMQFGAVCCGVANSTDWMDSAKWNTTYTYQSVTFQAVVPPSCCARTTEGKAIKDFTTLEASSFENLMECMMNGQAGTVNEMGCYERVRALVFDNKKIILAVFIVVVLIEIIAVSCACWLKNKADRKK